MTNVIELIQGMKYVYSDSTIDFKGIIPCTAVVVYKPSTRKALAWHSLSPIHLELDKSVRKNLRNLGKVEGLELYATGTAINEPLLTPYLLAERQFVEELFKNLGFRDSQTFIRWSPPKSITTFTFNTSNGSNELTIFGDGPEKIAYKGDIRKAPNPILF